MASIQVIQGPDKGRTFQIGDGDNVIGRQADEIPLGDGTVSRYHARLSRRNGAWLLEDLGSANGTFLNGERVENAGEVKRGDQIKCGGTLLVFGEGDERPSSVNVDENGRLVDAAIVATVPSNEDSVVIPTPQAGADAIDALRVLYELIAEISSVFDIDMLLGRTMDKVYEVLKPDRGYIMLIDEEGQLKLKTSRVSEQQSDNTELPVSRTIINEVTKKEVGVLSSNAMSDRRFESGKSVQNLGIRSTICVPIKGRQRIRGVIHVDRSVSDQTFSTEQLRLLTAIGYQAGLALENVELYNSALQSERLAAVGETVAVLSHHIKNILQGLSGGIDMAESALEKDDLQKVKTAWPIVQRNLGKINNLILNMLTYSKEREPAIENVNVNHVIQECVELATSQADARSVVLMTDLDDVPAIPADASGLHQVFLNMINNALDAVEDNTGVVTIKSSYDSMNRNVIVQVIDNGMGIEPDELSNIFEPFWSAKGQKGTGLGLAVARKIVREHGGDIEIQSQPKKGSNFTITLPTVPGRSHDTVGPANTGS